MTTNRERALHAAVDEVGEHGIRALTHARVDARAGLPKGSTSNWFRTRASLLAGLIGHIADAERSDAAVPPAGDTMTERDLVDLVCSLIETESGPRATRTRVRLALSLEAAHDADLLAPLLRQRAVMVEWMAALLGQVGADDPDEAARTLLACGNGLLFHRLTVDPDVEIRPVVERCVRACLA
ncbi:DNA-binding transcriptional regulator YbjK [Cryobacterium sp. MP_M5]|uniref:TetR/AcrR family transcriptional regulator n=1 Tax=unclassified Cryobacterium TaxID=2649013 RepID=UPI0018CAEC51|nr:MULTISPECIES: TetR family transcriptional regulator [unclassified Cryobacterium]MBG6058989.1 DNA-binding transcriptional regulator YbjK [Cryobacterium sp. MP_M3]MEC5178526.1 DNA-binding transcriptional regulator YbjK [Cryobacterium sp. MP_M5]